MTGRFIADFNSVNGIMRDFTVQCKIFFSKIFRHSTVFINKSTCYMTIHEEFSLVRIEVKLVLSNRFL